jgi:hypothetical protein
MKRKHQFLQAIQILAPNDSFIHRAARRVSEDTLPLLPGGAALEFVVAMERLRSSIASSGTTCGKPNPSTCRLESTAGARARVREPNTYQGQLRLSHALRVKSAEYWLKLGEPEQALLELRALPKSVQSLSCVLKVHLAAVHAAGDGYIARAE